MVSRITDHYWQAVRLSFFAFLLREQKPKRSIIFSHFSNLNFLFGFINYWTLNDWSRGEQWILFPENLNVSRYEVKGNIEIRGKQNSLFPKGPVIKWFVIEQNKTKAKFENRAEIPAITCNSGEQWTVDRVTVNCFLFDVIAFAMLPTHGIWRETVSLLDVMWPWTSQWKDAL